MVAPEIKPELIRYLESVYPDRAVDPSKVDPMRHWGQVEVIRHLRQVALQQEEDPLNVPSL